MSKLQQPWSVPVKVDDVPETGQRIKLSADETARQAIAALAGLRTLPRLAAVFDLTRAGGEGLHVTGEISATVGQSCVVTLDPIENEIVANVDLVFAPSAEANIDELSASGIGDGADGGPEALVDGGVDLGALATEFLLLGIDPYPRKPGVTFTASPMQEKGGGPFAALEMLKKSNENKR
jgi:hypothetical protein